MTGWIGTSMSTLVAAVNNSRLRGMGRQFQPGHSSMGLADFLWVVLGLIVLGLVAWGIVTAYNWWQTRTINSLPALFRELCRAHDLDQDDVDLLRDMVTWYSMENPSMIFLDAKRFDSPELVAEFGDVEHIRDLRKRLFG